MTLFSMPSRYILHHMGYSHHSPLKILGLGIVQLVRWHLRLPRSVIIFHSVTRLPLISPSVECGYHLHRSGDYISSANEFSATNWLQSTNTFLDKIQKDLTDDNWAAIFKALHWLQDSREHAAQVEAGAEPEEHELLLPTDPPTPPPV